MLAVDVSLERDSLLLEGLTRDVADVAEVFLVVDEFSVLFSECSECIKHDTWYDVAEQNTKEDTVKHVIGEADDLELFHGLTDGTWDKELQNTVKHGLAHLFWGFFARVNVLLIVAEGDSTEHEGKDDSHEADIGKFFDVHTDGFEDVSDFRVVAENIHDVEEVDGWMEEGPEEGYTYIDQDTIELSCFVEGLFSITSFQGFMDQW